MDVILEVKEEDGDSGDDILDLQGKDDILDVDLPLPVNGEEISDDDLELKPDISLERLPTDFLDCPECGDKFPSRDELNSHALTHDEMFKYFDVAMALVMLKPMVVIDSIKTYDCMKCTRVFKKRTEYELHKLVHLKDLLNKEDQPNKKVSNKKNQKQIKHGKINGQKQSKHSNINYQKATTADGDHDYAKRLKCHYCELRFVAPDTLQKHLITHRPHPYICFCGLGYQWIVTLEDHLKLAHKLAIQLPKVTNTKFDQLVDQWQHKMQNIDIMIIQHQKAKDPKNNMQSKDDRIMCQICTQAELRRPGAPLKLDSKLHCQLSEYADTQKCEECNEQFVQTPSLNVYRCHSCPKAFFGYKRLFKHEQKAHKKMRNENLNNVLGEISENVQKLL